LPVRSFNHQRKAYHFAQYSDKVRRFFREVPRNMQKRVFN